MKKENLITIAIVLVTLLICMAGCKNKNIPQRDYQIELSQDSIKVFDGERYVGGTKWEQKPTALDSVFLNDNL